MTYPSPPDPHQSDPYQAPQSPQYGAPYGQNPYSAANPSGQPDPYGQPNPYGQPDPYGQPNAYGQPNPYGQPVQPVQPQGTNGFAIASLIFGILGGVLFAIIFGIIALSQIPKRNQKGKGMAVAGLVLSLVWVLGCAGIIAIAALTDDPPAEPSLRPSVSTSQKVSTSQDLKLGDCINGLLSLDLSKELRRNPPKVDCAEPHEGEVFRVVVVSGSTFPGDAEIEKQAEAGCSNEALSAYAPDKKTQNLDIYYLYPTSGSWRSGDRDITCLVVSEKEKLTGSLKR